MFYMSIITAKKSQLEVVGLIIIVILISLALLFFIQFSLKKPVAEKRTFTTAQLTANTINTITKTSTNCSERTISDLYIDCANLVPFVDCTGNNIDDTNPCIAANQEVDYLLENTLIAWEKYFTFQVFIPEQDSLYNNSYNYELCSGNIESEEYYLPINQGLLYIKLNICED